MDNIFFLDNPVGDVTELLMNFERSEKVSVEMEFVYSRTQETCGRDCNTCSRFPYECMDWVCSNVSAPADEPVMMHGRFSRNAVFACPRDPSSCAYAQTNRSNSSICVHPDRGTDTVCDDCIDYTPACSQNINAFRTCSEYTGACPCDEIVRNCPSCQVFREILASKQQDLQNKLRPAGSNHNLKKGALCVKTDGSIPEGFEIPVVGRKIEYGQLLKDNTTVIDAILESNAIVTSRCGTHIHYLLGYHNVGGSLVFESEMPIPLQVVGNIFMFHAYFADALIWLTSAGTDMEHFTRWDMFRKMMRDIPYTNTFVPAEFARWLQQIPGGDNRYAFFNPCHLRYWEEGNKDNISVFHLEARYPDGILSPTVITSLQIMLSAMIRKSVKMASIGSVCFPYTQVTNTLSKASELMVQEDRGNRWPSNDEGRMGHTPLSKSELSKLKNKTSEMVEFFKPEILYYGEEPLAVLEQLAKEPCSVLISKDKNWEYIEKKVSRIAKSAVAEDVVSTTIREIILKRVIVADEPRKWLNDVASQVGVPMDSIRDYIYRTKNLIWDGGSFIEV